MILNHGLSVSAGIVTYNPELELLEKNIIRVINLVKHLWIVDNGSNNLNDIKNLILKCNENTNSTIQIVEFNENKGIAVALNKIMNKAQEHGVSWVLTLDQDTIVPYNIIESNKELLTKDGIGIIAPIIEDRNIKYKQKIITNEKYSLINGCITSASLTNVQAWEKVGKFDEIMFIDEVDYEFCARIINFGYRIYRNNEVLISHAIGKSKEIRFFGKWFSVQNHSGFRKYYQIRNKIYMARKLKGKIDHNTWIKIITIYIKVIFFEKQKVEKVIKMTKGLLDGFKM